ncbi:MAG: hypothetical protein IRZ16_10175 [Myxococcaceae bacterium]|nr:hypothetical protein [Myxococcaceae bacterium]
MWRWIAILAALGLTGCLSVHTQSKLIGRVVESDSAREKAFEATLRVLDEHPEYVDQLVQMTVRHPRTLDRFILNMSRDLEDPAIARMTAGHLVQFPRSLEQILIRTQEAAVNVPPAQHAISRAIDARAKIGVAAIASRPVAVKHLTEEMIAHVKDHPDARAQFLAAMLADRKAVMQMIASDKEALALMVDALTDLAIVDRSIADVILDRTIARMDEGELADAATAAVTRHPEVARSLVEAAARSDLARGIGGAAAAGIGNLPPIPQLRSALKKLYPKRDEHRNHRPDRKEPGP